MFAKVSTFKAKNFPSLYKITSYTDVYAFNGRLGNNLSGTNENKMPGVWDIRLGANYKYGENLSMHMSINNLLNRKYMLWNRFETQGFHFLIGAKYSFY